MTGRSKIVLKIAIGALIGGAAGYLVMHRLIGCPTGVCPLTRNPYMATLYGAVIGGLIASGV